jgi:predicted metal-binding membrane protein
MASSTPLAGVLKRDRALVGSALLGVTLLAWLYLVDMADMEDMSTVMAVAMDMAPWSASGFALMFLMWIVMMAGMMLPGTAPMILLFSTVSRKKRADNAPYLPTAAFALGYVLVWTAFSVMATILQGGLQQATLLSPMLVSTSNVLGGTLFMMAGVYQWTPVKRACLDNCRSPLEFILFRWRSGLGGALRMGLEHGTYCLGCCWVLMVLLFVGGVMNLLWVAIIALFVLAEKLAPGGEQVARVGGGVMIAIGMYLAVA